MKVINPRNRPKTPEGVAADLIQYVLNNSSGEEEWPEGWQMFFDFWTEPWPIKQPKPYITEHAWYIHIIRTTINTDNYHHWDDEWVFASSGFWEIMFDVYTYPEVIK